jgi:hypothetical protein
MSFILFFQIWDLLFLQKNPGLLIAVRPKLMKQITGKPALK